MNPAVALSPLPVKNGPAGVGSTYIIPNSTQTDNPNEQSDSQQTDVMADFPVDMLLSSVLAESSEMPVSDAFLSQEHIAEFLVTHSSSETPVKIAVHPLTLPVPETKAEMPVTTLPVTDTEALVAGLQKVQQQATPVAPGIVVATVQSSGITVAQRWQNEQPVAVTGSVTLQNQTAQPVQMLPVSSLQQFLQQWQNASQTTGTATQAEATVAVSSNHQSLSQASAATFQWKAESLGQQSASWGQKLLHLLSDKVNLQLGQQIQRAQIRLDPPHLGAIDLSVTVEGDRTTVQLYASSQQVRDAMQQHLDQLRQVLSQRMGEDMGIEVSVRQHNEQQEGKPFVDNEKIDQQHEAAAVTTEITQTGNKQHTGWLNRLA